MIRVSRLSLFYWKIAACLIGVSLIVIISAVISKSSKVNGSTHDEIRKYF